MLTATQKAFLVERLGTDTENFWDGEGSAQRTVINDGEIELRNGDFLRRVRVYVDRGDDNSKIVWSYRRKGEYLSDGEISATKAQSLIAIDMEG